MSKSDHNEEPTSSRREFLKTSTVAAVGATIAANFSTIPGAYAAGSDEIRIGLIGCGGRGTGAAINAMASAPGVKLVAMGDAFKDRLAESRKTIATKVAADKARHYRRSLLRRLRCLSEGARHQRRELHHPGNSARIQACAPEGCGGSRQADLHREARRGRWSWNSKRACNL